MPVPLSIDNPITWAPEEGSLEDSDQNVTPWRILIVDDDRDVHQSTELALRRQHILDRPLEFLHASSAAEALHCLSEELQIAVILLDVVMESDDAGLKLVREIRDTLKLQEVRIILRTGQPGYAPEVEAIRDYDINDYKTKTELTRNKLYTVLTTAIRSYDQIRQVNVNARGLQRLVEIGSELVGHHELVDFSHAVIEQVAGLLGGTPEGIVCVPLNEEKPLGEQLVIAAAGRYRTLIGQPLSQCLDPLPKRRLQQVLFSRRLTLAEEFLGLYIQGHQQQLALYLESGEPPFNPQRQLLELMASNIAVCLDNVSLVGQLRSYAFYDPLLSLPNRVHFLRVVDSLIASGTEKGYAIALIDIDHFSSTNDVLGHRFGDALLQAVAVRLQAPLSVDCTLARISADTFGLLGPKASVCPITIEDCLQQPFTIQGHELQVSATTGLVILEQGEADAETALKEASIALKLAKHKERGHGLYFEDAMATDMRDKMLLVQGLRKAMEAGQLFMVYQPQIELASGRTIGVEALIRWRDSDGALVPPDRFIPLAEQSGLIIALGEWVLRTACQEQKALTDAGAAPLRMAVNVSVNQFENPNFLTMVDRVLQDTGIDPAMLELEITESVAVLDPELLIGLLQQLKARRITLAIDDFGTGFSSLNHLQKLPVDRLKIDRSFIQQLCDDQARCCIAEMVISLAKSLELAVIAEGVEALDQVQRLQSLGCDEIQGYFYARPMEKDALCDWLQANGGWQP